MEKFRIKFNSFFKALGPGLIFAGTSVGVSHVVQSTRAGAMFGFSLILVVILANLIKFPFFEFAPRYSIATGESILSGYRRLGKWAFGLFIILSLATMFPIMSGVTIVCAGLVSNLIHWPYSLGLLSAIILTICGLILLIGRFCVLDRMMKVMILILTFATVVAFVMAVIEGPVAQPEFMTSFDSKDLVHVSFVLALIGWMPTAIDISVWHSFWTLERARTTGYMPTMKEGMLDFHIGYWGTAVLALFFVGLGSLVMYGSGENFSDSAVGFTGQVISLYTKSLGSWSYPLIVTAATITMFSTVLSCFDAYPRTVRETVKVAFPEKGGDQNKVYMVWLIFLGIVSVLIISFFAKSMKSLIDFATILSFLSAPLFGFLNLKVVTSKHVPEHLQPKKWVICFAWFGIICGTIFGVFFLSWKFGLIS